MSRILEGLEEAECNIDDVPVHAPTRELHNKRLEQVLEQLATGGVTLNIKKCVFKATRFKFLGNVVSAHGKVAAVTDLTALKSVHDVHVFLGIVNHMSKGSHARGPPVGLGTTSMKGI